MGKLLTHEIIEERRVDFGKSDKKLIKVRLLKHHIVDEGGIKYRKDNGYMVGGRRYAGVYVELFSLDVSTLKEIPATHI